MPNETIPPFSIRERAVSGLFWSFATTGLRQGIGLVTGIVLARLLFPSDFGIVAMVQVFTGIAFVIFEVGIAGALIQAKTIREEDCSSIFWLNALLGTALSAVFAAFAGQLASFYAEPRLVPVALSMSLVFVLDAAASIHRALLIRDLDFKRLGKVEVGSVLVTNGVAIATAALGFGFWSLVLQNLLSSLVFAVLVWTTVSWRPAFSFNWRNAKPLFQFGTTLAGSRLLAYSARNLDIMFIGLWLGSTGVGYFNFSYRVMVFPVWSVVGVVSRVMFSLLAKIQDEKERTANLYLRVLSLTSTAVFPVLSGIIVTAGPLVSLVLGEHWNPMIPILRILCVVGILDAMTASSGQLYLAQGKAGLHLKMNLTMRVLSTVGILIGLGWGLTGAALGMVIAASLYVGPALWIPCRLLGMPFLGIVRALIPPLGCSLAMSLPVLGTGILLTDLGMSLQTVFAGQTATGVALYAVLVWLINPGNFRENLGTLRLVLKHRTRPSEVVPPGDGAGNGQSVGIFDISTHRDP